MQVRLMMYCPYMLCGRLPSSAQRFHSSQPHCLANQEGLESPLATALDDTCRPQNHKFYGLDMVGFQQASNEKFYSGFAHEVQTKT